MPPHFMFFYIIAQVQLYFNQKVKRVKSAWGCFELALRNNFYINFTKIIEKHYITHRILSNEMEERAVYAQQII